MAVKVKPSTNCAAHEPSPPAEANPDL